MKVSLKDYSAFYNCKFCMCSLLCVSLSLLLLLLCHYRDTCNIELYTCVRPSVIINLLKKSIGSNIEHIKYFISVFVKTQCSETLAVTSSDSFTTTQVAHYLPKITAQIPQSKFHIIVSKLRKDIISGISRF